MVLAAPCFTFGLVTAAGELVKPTPPAAVASTTLIWADRVFSEKDDFATWLKARGVRYKDWALAHPAARSVFEPQSGQRSAANAEPPQTDLAIGLVVASALGLVGVLAMMLFKSLRPARLSRRRIPSPYGRVRLSKPGLRGMRIPQPVTRQRLSGARTGWTALRHHVSSIASSFAASLRFRGTGEDETGALEYEDEVTTRRLSGARTRGTALRERVASTASSFTASLPTAKPRVASSGARSAALEYEPGAVAYEKPLSPRLLQRLLPDLVWYGSSILLALVIGASIALYLH